MGCISSRDLNSREIQHHFNNQIFNLNKISVTNSQPKLVWVLLIIRKFSKSVQDLFASWKTNPFSNEGEFNKYSKNWIQKTR